MRKREGLAIIFSIAIAILVIKLAFFLLFPIEVIVIDYSETKWQEIKGFKSKGYDINVTINYETKTDSCREERSFFSAVDGSSGSYYIPQTQELSFDTNSSQDGVKYVINYPLNFRQKECEFLVQEMRVCASSNESRQTNSKFDSLYSTEENRVRAEKDNYNRRFNEEVIKIIHSPDKDKEEDQYRRNIYCQRSLFFGKKVNYVGDKRSEEEIWTPIAYCRRTVFSENLTVVYWDLLKEHKPMVLNILLSEDIKCHGECNDTQMSRLGMRDKIYDNKQEKWPETDTHYKYFKPSETLFTEFKKLHIEP